MDEKIIVDSTIASRVTERLREDIISKRIEAGSRITIKQISELYGTSNMPVREAFRTLEGEKLLEINAYKGATVLTIDETFVRETYGLLRALECLVYETAFPQIDDAVIERLEMINTQILNLGEHEEDKIAYIDMNSKFHGIIMALGTNARAVGLYSYYHMLVRTLRKRYVPRPERIKAAAKEHQELIAALRTKDIVLLKKAVDQHASAAMNNFLRQYDQENWE